MQTIQGNDPTNPDHHKASGQAATLLPHCRFQPPEWISDTIHRLLDEYEAQGCKPPFFNRALLVMEAFCDVDSRQVYDEDTLPAGAARRRP